MSIFAPLLLSLAAVNAKKTGDMTPSAMLEIAPLRGMLGQLAVRAEAPFLGKFAVAGAYDQFATASERANFHDTHTATAAETLFYPLGFNDYPVFFAAGVRRENATTGRQRLRDTNSWARTNADELYDRWTNHDTFLSSTQSLGYRLNRLGFATASLRYVRDEVISASSSVGRDDVRGFDPDLSSRGRKRVMSSLLLHAGVYLP